MLKVKLPPGPTSSQDEQAFRLFSKPYTFLKECEQEYGDCFTLDFKGLGKHVFFSHPQAIQQIFSGPSEVYHAGEGNAILRPFLGKFSLLTLDEAVHKRHRRIMTPAFQPQSLTGFINIMQKIVQDTIAQWIPGQIVSMQKSMLDISLDVILGAVFGIEDKIWTRLMKKALGECLNDIGSNPLPLMQTVESNKHSKKRGKNAWDQFQRKLSDIDQLIYAQIAKRRSFPDSSEEDALTLLLSAKDEGNLTLSDQELRDELMTLLIAGHETSATTLAWAFYWIHCNSNVLELCVKELDNVDPNISFASLSKLPYLDAILKETLRINPVIPLVSRKLQTEVQIQDWVLPAGIHATACIYLTHHRSDLYPDPETFRPERFLDRQFSSFEYYPFGGGARRCIGMYFAQAEMKIILSKALRSFSFALEKGESVRPVRRSVTLAPSGGLKMHILSKRELDFSER